MLITMVTMMTVALRVHVGFTPEGVLGRHQLIAVVRGRTGQTSINSCGKRAYWTDITKQKIHSQLTAHNAKITQGVGSSPTTVPKLSPGSLMQSVQVYGWECNSAILYHISGYSPPSYSNPFHWGRADSTYPQGSTLLWIGVSIFPRFPGKMSLDCKNKNA